MTGGNSPLDPFRFPCCNLHPIERILAPCAKD